MNIQSSNYLLLHHVVSREIFNQKHFGYKKNELFDIFGVSCYINLNQCGLIKKAPDVNFKDCVSIVFSGQEFVLSPQDSKNLFAALNMENNYYLFLGISKECENTMQSTFYDNLEYECSQR